MLSQESKQIAKQMAKTGIEMFLLKREILELEQALERGDSRAVLACLARMRFAHHELELQIKGR